MPESANRAVPTGYIFYSAHDFIARSKLRCEAVVIHFANHLELQKLAGRQQPPPPDAARRSAEEGLQLKEEARRKQEVEEARLRALFTDGDDDTITEQQPEDTSKPQPSEPSTTPQQSSTPQESERYVITSDLNTAVKDHEGEVLSALGIDWNARAQHITCPYIDHADKHPSWRWDTKARRAHCTCAKGVGIIDVVIKVEGIDFDGAKLRIAEILHRDDLIRTKGQKSGGKRDYLHPPSDHRDDSLPQAYLAHRLSVPPADVLMPSTPVAGWKRLGYYEGSIENHIGDYPCAIFGLVNPKGREHAHRIYVAPAGKGKAGLPLKANGKARDPKKAAPLAEDDRIDGRSAIWGNADKAHTMLVGEGVETCQALAQAHADAIRAGTMAVAAAISSGWMKSWRPWPATEAVIIVADRDEGKRHRGASYQDGGKAAEALAGKLVAGGLRVSIALPGEAETDCDALNLWEAGGASAVTALVAGAKPWTPKATEDVGQDDRPVPPVDQTEAGEPSPTKVDERRRWAAVTPVPASAGEPPNAQPWKRYRYADSEDRLLGYVDRGSGPGQIHAWTWRHPPGQPERAGWAPYGLPEPKPLYGLARLSGAERVLLVEDERTADAAQEIAPAGTAVLAFIGAFVERTDYRPLADLPVTGWARRDGQRAMICAVARANGAGASDCKIVNPPSSAPDGWSPADPWPEPDVDAEIAFRAAVDAAVPLRKAVIDQAAERRVDTGERAELPVAPLIITRPKTFQGRVAPRRLWAVPDWVPMQLVTGLYGDGGLGKTILLQMMDTCFPTGHPWLGIEIERMPAMGVFCEDPEDEMWRRQESINRHLGIDMSDLDGMCWFNRYGEDNILMEFDGNSRRGRLTDFYWQLVEALKRERSRILTLDTVADIFGGNENDRQQARFFVQVCLGGLARAMDGGAVIASAHPSRAGLKSGEGDSGSTGWNNAFRSRLYITAPTADPDGDEAPDDNERTLYRKKANYAVRRAEMNLRWDDNFFLRTTPLSTDMVDVLTVDGAVLDGLRSLIDNGAKVPADPHARNGFANIIRTLPACKRFNWTAVCAAQERLVALGKLVRVELGSPSRRIVYIRPADMRYPGEPK